MSAPTWIVWSAMPPECQEKICCESMLDAARAWADRQFKKGMLPRTGTQVFAYCQNDAAPRSSTYRLTITLVNAPAFRASFAGLAFEGTNGDPAKGGGHG